MSVTLAAGSQIAIASVYGATKNMTALTNATEAVATLEASHGVIVGDILEVTSGWGRLDGRIVRAKTVATNDVTFELIDTSNTTQYPAGQGIGTVREITTWVDISQTQKADVSGGEQKYADVTFLVDVIERQKPTTRSPIVISIPYFDDPALAWIATVRAAANAGTPTAMRIIAPNSSKTYANAYWSLLDVPTLEGQSAMISRIDTTFSAEKTRYAT